MVWRTGTKPVDVLPPPSSWNVNAAEASSAPSLPPTLRPPGNNCHRGKITPCCCLPRVGGQPLPHVQLVGKIKASASRLQGGWAAHAHPGPLRKTHNGLFSSSSGGVERHPRGPPPPPLWLTWQPYTWLKLQFDLLVMLLQYFGGGNLDLEIKRKNG